jgi:uroporphyrinogen decarboxylase
MRIPIENPQPDFETFERVLKGETPPAKVHFAELGIDDEVMQAIVEDGFGERWVPLSDETREAYIAQRVALYHRLGYDFFPSGPEFRNMPQFKERVAADTAGTSRRTRHWVDEGGGIIKTWADFERIDWDAITPDVEQIEIAARHLPDGMKISVCACLFETCLERFFGYEDLFVLSVEDPALVEKVFDVWGRKVYDAYAACLDCDGVGAIFHADDLGYRTSTMLSPAFLRKTVFPWFAKYAALAHDHGLTYWYHSCGNPLAIMDDLIDDVRIDAFHSFQDPIITAGDFVARYGDRIAALGGIDMDKLARLPEPELRAHVRETLDACMPGRFALGSGNTVANYIPVNSYLAMLDEGCRYRG